MQTTARSAACVVLITNPLQGSITKDDIDGLLLIKFANISLNKLQMRKLLLRFGNHVGVGI
jgi:hypothetical protein